MEEDSEVKQQINKALYALLSLAVAGVVAFAAYVVSDVKVDVDRCRTMLIGIHQEIATMNATQARRGEQIDEVKRQVKGLHDLVDKRLLKGE